jgi:outer membrane protein OmpA-like peptidoglycan-associated protein
MPIKSFIPLFPFYFVAAMGLLFASGCAIQATPYEKITPPIAVPVLAAGAPTYQPTPLSFMSTGMETDRGILFTLDAILFDVNKATLRSEARQRLDEIAQQLNRYGDSRFITIEGHTDSTGSAKYNQKLSESRANSVKQALLSRGIAAHRINTEGFGQTRPTASNTDASGRQLNRRVEIILLNDPHTSTVTTTYNPSLELR